MPYDGRLLAGVSVLMAVVEAGGMARAAEAVGLTPSGVGRAIARLEARVGVRLLDRTTRAMRLTDEGRRFYEQVRPHLDGLEEAAIEAAGSRGAVRGRLRVNMDAFLSRMALADAIGGFLDAHPDLRIELVMRDLSATLSRTALTWRCASVSRRGAALSRRSSRDPHSDGRRAVLHRRAWTAGAPFRDRGPRLHRFLGRRQQAPVRVGVPQRRGGPAGRTARPVDDFRSRNHAGRLRRGSRHRADHATRDAGLAREWRARRIVSGLERRSLSALRGLPFRHHRPAKVRAFVDFVVATIRLKR